MSAVGRARSWLRAVVLRSRLEREMHEEMAAHLAQAAARFRARGMSESDAIYAARREFGHLGATQQSAREARGGQWIDSVAGDVRYAFRYFARTPLMTITIVLTLALGIGFSSSVFSVLTGILTRPAPGVPDDPALVRIRGLTDARPYGRLLSYPELTAYAGLTSKFESVVAWVTTGVVVDAGDRDLGAVSARAQFVTPNYFRTLGIQLAAGGGFGQSRFDDLAPPELTAVVSDGLASERFGGASGAVGKHLRVNGADVTIVGVTVPRFAGVVQSGETRMIWLPLSSWLVLARIDREVFANPNAASFDAAARLRSGVALPEASSAVRVVAARIDADTRARATRRSTPTADVVRLRGLMDVTGRYDDELGPGAVVFTAIALLILLVCTTTVNSLLVGAAVARRYEIGVRLALGASRRRVVRQLLTEIVILSITGGALGMWAFAALSRVIEVARDGFDVSPNWGTTIFTLLYALATATLCGLSPALHATRTGLSEVLKDSAGGATARSRLQRTFVVAQIAIAQPLMVALAAVMATIAGQIPATGDVALRERVLAVDLDTHVGFSRGAPDEIPDLLQRLKQLPGVISALAVGYGQGRSTLELPPSPALADSSVPPPRFVADAYDVPPGYFRAVGAPIVRGREFVPSDTTLAVTPVIINERLAGDLFKSGDPIGRRLLRVVQGGERALDARPAEVEVVGVVSMAAETNSLQYPSDLPPMFVPFRRRQEGHLLIRTTGPAEPLIPTVMAMVREDARMLPLIRINTLAQGDRARRTSRLEVAGAVAGCGMIALILASVGLYAMLSVAVGQRRREIGIRVALGARARQVVTMFFTSGFRVALLGLAFGLPLSIVGLVVVKQQTDMLGVNLTVVATLVTLVVGGVASLASWLPARRAAVVDPMIALRSE